MREATQGTVGPGLGVLHPKSTFPSPGFQLRSRSWNPGSEQDPPQAGREGLEVVQDPLRVLEGEGAQNEPKSEKIEVEEKCPAQKLLLVELGGRQERNSSR